MSKVESQTPTAGGAGSGGVSGGGGASSPGGPGAGGGAAPGSPGAGKEAPLRIPRPAGGPGRGGPFAGMNVPAEKAMNFWPSAKRLLGELRPERLWLTLVLLLAVVSVTFSVIGPRLLGEGTNLIFAGVVSKQLPAGVSKAQLIAQLRAAGENQKADMLGAMAPDARHRNRLHSPVLGAAVGAGAVRAGVGVHVDAGIYPQRCGAADRVPAPRADRGEDQPAAAALLRHRAARRAAQPRHQRRGQHLPKPAAVHQPGGDLAADRGRGAGDDGDPLAHAGDHRAGDHSADPGDDGADRQALAEAVRGAVEEHRRAERADRGDVHRSRAGEGLRPAARGGGDVPAEERGAVPGELRRAVHFRADHAGHDVHREPGLCGDRRGGRPTGGVRGDAAGRRAGLHPVLAAVHPAAGPAGLDGEPAAVRRGVGGAGVRAAGHRGAADRPGCAGQARIDARAAGVRGRVLRVLAGQAADLRPVAGGASRGRRWRSWGPPGRGRPPW